MANITFPAAGSETSRPTSGVCTAAGERSPPNSPTSAGQDRLAGEQCNISTPKIVAALRLAEETGSERYWNAARNFWDIATAQHAYVIGGQGNHEHWGPPGVLGAALSNYTCEGCVSYNMLKLTRLLHFHAPGEAALMDYYERTLVNHLLGTQDPASPHGFVAYYTGLSAGAVKRQPLNYFPHGNPDVYATDYGTFTCDTATGLETPTKFGDTIYSRDPAGLRVNLLISSQVSVPGFGLTLRQVSGLPDVAATALAVVSGAGRMTLRVRVPAWACPPFQVRLNGQPISLTPRPAPSSFIALSRVWRRGDRLDVTFGMRLEVVPAPDMPSVQAVTYGPVVLAGLADGAPGARDARARRVVGAPGGGAADGLRGGRGRPSGATAAGLPHQPRPLHGVLADHIARDRGGWRQRGRLPMRGFTATRGAGGPRTRAGPARGAPGRSR